MNKIFNKKIVFWAAAVLVVFLMSCSTVLVLKTFFKKNNTANQSAGQGLKSAEVINKLNIGLAGELVKSGYNRQINLNATINYTMDDYNFELAFDSNNSILLSVDKNPNDNQAIKNKIVGFMEDNGLSLADYRILKPNKDLEYLTYVNGDTVCQFSNTKNGSDVKLAYYEVVCLDKKVMQDKYAQVNKLLAIYKKSGYEADFSQVAIRTGSGQDQAYAIVDLNSDKKGQKLLFVATKNSWDYLGDLLSGGKQYSNGKYSITPELKKKIEDPKYEALLRGVIAKG